jgi:hypothetical protein
LNSLRSVPINPTPIRPPPASSLRLRNTATPRAETPREGEGISSGKHELGLRRPSLSSSNREIRRTPTIEDGPAAARGRIRLPRPGRRQQQLLEGAGAASVQGVGGHHLRAHRRHHRHFRGWYPQLSRLLFGSYLV